MNMLKWFTNEKSHLNVKIVMTNLRKGIPKERESYAKEVDFNVKYVTNGLHTLLLIFTNIFW